MEALKMAHNFQQPIKLYAIVLAIVLVIQQQRPTSSSNAQGTRRTVQNRTKSSRHSHNDWDTRRLLTQAAASFGWPLARREGAKIGSPESDWLSDEDGLAADTFPVAASRHYQELGQRLSLGGRLDDRFDDHDHDYHHKHHHDSKLEIHQKESKEISFVYPLLLSLLILGALFVPFISLFFFLAVSAFNCHTGAGGLGGGLSQVTPVFGRRRRRRKRSVHGEAEVDAGEWGATVGRADRRRGPIASFAQSVLEDFEERFLARPAAAGGGQMAAAKSDEHDERAHEWNLITTKLPLSMLFDALEFVDGAGGTRTRNELDEPRTTPSLTSARHSSSSDNFTASSGGRRRCGAMYGKNLAAAAGPPPDARRSADANNNLRFAAVADPALNSSDAWNEHKLWQQQLANSTVLLRNALVKFIDF
jgi:hypothetical protein